MIKTTLQDLLCFIIKPNDKQISLSVVENIRFVIVLFTMKIIITGLFVLPVLLYVDQCVNASSYSIADPQHSVVKIFIATVLIGPVMEELVFRYFLRYNRFTAFIIRKDKWQQFFPMTTYLSVIFFAGIHLNNYVDKDLMFYIIAPFLVSSQILSGIFLSFIRLRLNFFNALLFHSMWNLLVFLIPEDMLYFLSAR